MINRLIAKIVSLASVVVVSTTVLAQVSLTATGTPVTQNFDTLSATGSTTWANNSTLTGWYATATAAVTSYTASIGDGTAGVLYSYGAAGNSDRALGAQPTTAAGGFFYAVRLANNTGVALSSLDVSFVCEQWRNGGNATAQTLSFEYQVGTVGSVTGANAPSTGWTPVTALNCTTPVATASAAALNGNLPANQVSKSGTITVAVPASQEIWLRWVDVNDSGNEHGIGIDSFSVTPNGGVVGGGPNLSINDVSVAEGNSGTTIATFTVTLSQPAPRGGITFDIATADGTATVANNDYVARSLTGQAIPEGQTTYTFDVTINGDATGESNETFFVNVTNVVRANVIDGQGQGTILNDDFVITPINQIQGNAATSPLLGSTVTTRGIVTAVYPGFRGFYIQSQAIDEDADPVTSEGIFVFMNSTTLSAEAAVGNLLQVTGPVGEFGASPRIATQIGTTAVAPTVVLLSVGNALPAPVAIALPLASATALERYEGMRVSLAQTLTVSGNFTLGRYGEVVLSSNGRLINPSNAIDLNDDPPSGNSITGTSNVAAVQAAIAANALNQVTLDDATSTQNPDPAPFGVSAANADTLRAGSTITGVIGIVNQIDRTNLSPTDPGYRLVSDPNALPQFNRAARPLTPPSVGGQIKAAGFNVLNYFNGNGTNQEGAPGGFPTARGATTLVEYNRQSAKTVAAITQLTADIVGVIEMENDDTSGTDCSGGAATTAACDLVSKLNTAQAAAQWTKVPLPANWGPTAAVPVIGSSDAITTRLLYKNANVEAVGAPLACNDAAFTTARTPLAQVFRSRATGGSVIVSINHFKSKGSCPTTVGDPNADQGDGQGCWAPLRLEQAQALIACVSQWQTQTGEQRVLLLGDFNAYEQENAIDAFRAAGMKTLIDDSYSFVFDGNSGSLDHAIATSALVPQVTGANKWHINADEPISLDYNTEFKSVAQQASLYAPDPFRSSDHDPALVGMNLSARCAIDVDGNGLVEPSKDGLLVLRYLLGYRGLALVDGAVVTNPGRDTPQIEAYLAALDLDVIGGDGGVRATADGLLILRVLLGLNENALLTGIFDTSDIFPSPVPEILLRLNTRLRYACPS
jgi:uncharacterized protein